MELLFCDDDPIIYEFYIYDLDINRFNNIIYPVTRYENVIQRLTSGGLHFDFP